MIIHRINNHYHAINRPAISCNGSEYWFLNGKLHRGGGKPAVVNGGTCIYFWRGIFLTKQMASGEMSPAKILKIENMEQRQASMEIVGYEKFFNMAKLLDKFTPVGYQEIYPVDTNPMYSLYVLLTQKDELGEEIKILSMIDPSEIPIMKYFIRVDPREKNCRDAVAHSYDFKTYEEYIQDKKWY